MVRAIKVDRYGRKTWSRRRRPSNRRVIGRTGVLCGDRDRQVRLLRPRVKISRCPPL